MGREGKGREEGSYVDSLFSGPYSIFRRLNMKALASFEMLESAYPMTRFHTPEHLIRTCQFLRDPSLRNITVKYFNSYRQCTLYSHELFISINFRNRIKFDLEKRKAVYYCKTMVPTYEVTKPHNRQNHKLKFDSEF